MKNSISNIARLMGLLLVSVHICAQQSEIVGGDTYLSGSSPSATEQATRDLFISGFSVSLEGKVEGDAHAAGFNIDVEDTIAGDFYAAGSNISIEGAIGDDLTAAGFNIELEEDAAVAGNVRVAAGNISVESPISGSLVVSAGTIHLDASVGGDVKLAASEITFGPNAQLLGQLTYSAPEQLDISASVIDEGSVSYVPLNGRGFNHRLEDGFGGPVFPVWLAVWGAFFGFVSTLLVLWLISTIMLLVAPEKVDLVKRNIFEKPWKMLLLGFLTLALLSGLVPALLVTLIGIPLIPLILLVIVLICLVGFLLGVFTLSWQISLRVKPLPETTLVKLGVMAIGLVAVMLLGGVPFLGWILKLAITLIGIGAIITPLIEQRLTNKTPKAVPASE